MSENPPENPPPENPPAENPPGNGEPTEPTQDEIDRFNAAAQQHADNNSLTLAEGVEQLGNLLVNLVRDPVGTRVFFLEYRLAQLEPVLEVVDGLDTVVANHENRIAHLEDISG